MASCINASVYSGANSGYQSPDEEESSGWELRSSINKGRTLVVRWTSMRIEVMDPDDRNLGRAKDLKQGHIISLLH